jgi:hypothetical protein
VAGTYHLDQYRTENEEALQAWADHVDEVVGHALTLERVEA